MRVANPPAKPLMLWDGECHFCRHWIERWQAQTAGAVDYATSQSAGENYPEIPGALFARAVVLVEPDGNVCSGAQAVFRSLAAGGRHAWLRSWYENVPGFAYVAEFFYSLIARNREFASSLTRFLTRRKL